MKTKYPRYQDYVIKDGKLIGEFEEMYRDFEDPWEQTTRERDAFEKLICLEIIRREGYRRVIELGCGFGEFTSQIQRVSGCALGIDISQTAIHEAKKRHSDTQFVVGDILDFNLYRNFRPDCVVLSEITWYILDKLEALKSFLRQNLRGGGIIHLLMTYASGEQKYGREFFTNLDEIMEWWDCVDYRDWGTLSKAEYNGGKRTFFHGIII